MIVAGRFAIISVGIHGLAVIGLAVARPMPRRQTTVTFEIVHTPPSNVGNIDTGVYWNKVNLRVCHAGDTLPSNDFPLLAQFYLEGKLNLDGMVTRQITLDQVEDAFHEMETGNVIRSVIKLPQ